VNPNLEIFSQGEEIITGQTVDTNAAWLSQQSIALGFNLTRHSAVGDKIDDLVGVLKDIAQRADCCICTGGLGPTSDDLTAEAVTLAFQMPLQFDALAFQQMQTFFATRNKAMPESNRKQAMLPQGSLRIDNNSGTAPGFALQHERCWFVFLPGVPSEMRQMFQETIHPLLSKRFELKPSRLITFRTIGIGESDIQQRIKSLRFAEPVQLGFRADTDEVQVKLLFPSGFPDPELKALVASVYEKLGRHVFAIDGWSNASGDLVSVVDKLMLSGNHKLAVIETASQGLLAAKCIGSNWLLEAHYHQSMLNFAERRPVPIDRNDLIAIGKELAFKLQKSIGVNLVLIQIYAEDFAQFIDFNQTIKMHCLLLNNQEFVEEIFLLAGSAKRKQNQAALLTLDLLRRNLQPDSII
jgi:nicotinamide-nucleotide amidase